MTGSSNLEREGWKSPSRTLATLAKPGGAAKLAEGLRRRATAERLPITTWQLLIWTYQRQKAHLGEGRVGATGHAAISATGAVLERMRLGVSVDTSRGLGPAASATRCNDDALHVHGDVMRLGRYSRPLIEAALLGSPPDWQPFIPPLRCGPILRGNGQPKMLYEHNRPIACILAYDGFLPRRAAEVIRFARDSYTAWWASLSVLHEALAEGQPLKRWRVTEIGVPAEPWC